MLSNLPSRINYRTPSDIRQDLRNWVQPISEMTTEPVRKPLQPISEQSTALGEVLRNHSAKHQPAAGGSATNQRHINRHCLNLRNIAVWSRLSTLSESFPLRFSVQFRNIFLTGSRKICQLASKLNHWLEFGCDRLNNSVIFSFF